MLLFGVLFGVTLLVIAGYFILFTAQHAEGSLKPFGKYLALWVFVLAGLLVLGAALAPTLGYRGLVMRGGPAYGRGFGPGGFGDRRRGPRFLFRQEGPGAQGAPSQPPETEAPPSGPTPPPAAPAPAPASP
jgi:hypothetical protein